LVTVVKYLQQLLAEMEQTKSCMRYFKSVILLLMMSSSLVIAVDDMDSMSASAEMDSMNATDMDSMSSIEEMAVDQVMPEPDKDQLDDESKEYYDNGALHFEYSYLDGQLHGTTKEYYETGEPKAEIVYDRGKQVSARYFLRNGKLERETRYVGGKKNETQMEYYTTGELFRERKFINGKLEGLEKEYYQNGKLKAERNYINGKKEGSAKGYHKNGNLQGDWIFQGGAPVSATIYYRTGELWLEHSAFDASGRLNGISLEYDKQGSLIAERYYVDDQLVKRKRKLDWFMFF
jgi:antitoxin component YwqK of YwqJK toxin-antitoxin module